MQPLKMSLKFIHIMFHLLLHTLLFLSILTNCKPLLDSNGDHLQTGTDYYLLPVETGNGGGGLALSAKDHPCPFYVMQENQESSKGHPVKLFSADKNLKAVKSATDINIVFMAETICVQSTAWKVGGVDWRTGHRYVMSNGFVGNPGADTLSSWFKFEKHEKGKGYKIVFCPSVCKTCKVVCGNLGVFEENGTKWLGLSDESLAIQFKKV